MRVPEIESTFDLFIGTVYGVLGAVEIAGFFPVGGRKIQPIAHNADVRRIIIDRQVFRKRMAFPVGHIFRYPYCAGHGSEQIVFPLELHHGRISRFPIDAELPFVPGIIFELIRIRHIHRIAKNIQDSTSASATMLRVFPSIQASADMRKLPSARVSSEDVPIRTEKTPFSIFQRIS